MVQEQRHWLLPGESLQVIPAIEAERHEHVEIPHHCDAMACFWVSYRLDLRNRFL
jgi:hypothetical protein